ncbi:MAG: VWA domain-containing protein [Bacillota bacterium]
MTGHGRAFGAGPAGSRAVPLIAGRGFEGSLVAFASLLRHLGVGVSTAEVMDAVAALRVVGLSDRAQVKTALQAALVKDLSDVPLYSALFDAFFVPPEERRRQMARHAQRAAAAREGSDRAAQDLRLGDRPLSLEERHRRTYAGLSEEERQRIRRFLDRAAEDGRRQPSLEAIVDRVVRRYLEDRSPLSAGRPHREPVPLGDESLDACLSEACLTLAEKEEGLRFVDLESVDEAQLPQVEALIRRLSRRLATMLSRRYRLSRRRPAIDIRRTIRKNIGTGGVPFRLSHRSKKVRKPRLLLVNDVSGSMARYAAFVTMFLYGLTGPAGRVEVFIFSEDLERVTDRLTSGSGFRETMRWLMGGTRQWGRGTNLGQALRTLFRDHEELLTPSTVVLVLSDTKTLAVDEAVGRLAEAGSRVRDILWLNPLPAAEWERVPTVAAFRGVARMYECSTVQHLERILHEVMLRGTPGGPARG